jgi:uroporphyrinogen decarboxylase
VPFAGVHAGKLKGYDAFELLNDEEKLIRSLLEVNRIYKPHGQPVVFDLQIEAECLGCELVWAKNAPPSVKTHPLANNMIIPCKCTIPSPESGRLPMILNVMRRMKAEVGDTTALYGLICGPFTLASHLRGNDIFMDMYDDEDYVKGLLAYCKEVVKKVAGYYTEAGMDVIAVVDPLISQISESHFTEFMSEPFTDIFKHIRSLGAFSSFFVCGDATRNIEVMCKTGPDSVSVDENVDFLAAKKITDRYNVALGGNIPLTTVMLHGTQQDNMKYVIDLIDSMKDKRNLIIAPGCDMPYDVPVENGIGAAQAVHNTEDVRNILKNYKAAEEVINVELPDYNALKKPLLEVFTLDSATCAACSYMMNAANLAKERFGNRIDVVEYKFTTKENIARCKKMGVPNLPSMYINGVLKFRSIIPGNNILDAAITEAEKGLGL